MAHVTIYDGADNIGGNKILLEDAGTRALLDFGTSFASRFKFFEEFLAPRSRAGLLDLIHMGLLPPLWGIYRHDLQDPSGRSVDRAKRFPLYRDCRVDAVLLSHAHMDHCGYISFLEPSIPIVTTAMTAYLCKAIQDCGAYQFEGEMCYAIPKLVDSDGTVGSAPMKNFPYIRRPYAVADAVPNDPTDFWNLSPSPTRGRLFPNHRLQVESRVGSLNFRYFAVDHSIYGAAAIAIESSAGWVVYTGDLRRHGSRADLTTAFIEEAAKLSPIALICEGTNIERQVGPTEEGAFAACLDVVKNAHGRFVVADFGPRNIERLQSFLEIARLTERRLVIMDRDAYLLTAMHAVDATIPTPKTEPQMQVYRRALRGSRAWMTRVRELYPDQVTATQIQADPGAYILCISFFDVVELVDIDPQSGVWIYSSSEPHNEDQQMDLWRLRNWIEHFHLTPVGVTEGPSGFHASGHISGPELIELIRQIRPGRVIPVHTAAPQRFAEMLHDTIRVDIAQIGDAVNLTK